ncbi:MULTISPECIES: DUF1361 domain-containing protein [Streptococcus]|jgi:uncharacterized membrane protein|uniref:Uncharacterized membrane protein n=1 Tax=Streptococcus equinus TaxID=1335 RepID=A0A1G9NCU3_STREI|nr:MULTISPECIES: DUF1361 domain-containing protein [Streptococcus]MDO4885981.1 DUF1361 domain-containing protein [Streptococcus sp.]MEE0950241.1 DUF1361 domain-containing protein [Streptococcus equinus]QGX44007.1 DUF1361 domain-containing protein [Streptococcus equinus]QGX46447.1 DUF1361 domain-containing protein [Streptococcus equinus]QMS96741.1 DUF1361 domain-containing protein [Streptococcus equinus]
MVKKIAIVHFFFGVISLGIYYYHLEGPDLIWNMFLALVALDFSLIPYFIKNKAVKVVAAILWLFFYPNTFYMLTDIVHMNFTSSVLWDKSSLILYMLYVSSILFGVLCGIESVKNIVVTFKVKNYYIRMFFIAVLSFVSSFAIHIGRYARLNSWDIFTRPTVVIKEILDVISWNALHFVLGFTFLQLLCLIFLDRENFK